MTRIAIVGLGLIGGSLGLAIHASGRKNIEIIGTDLDRGARRTAQRIGAVDSVQRDLRRTVEDAGLIILATPPGTIKEILQIIGPALSTGAAVTDVASTKMQIMDWARDLLPRGVSFVGGHPMAGSTHQGIANATADLFQGAPYAVVLAPSASEEAVRSVLGLIGLIGATERFMTAEEHDYYVGAVSHMPLVASTALFSMLRRSESWSDFGKIAGPAYRDLTRLASGDPQMSADIASTNRQQIQYWLDRYIVELRRVRDLLDQSDADLFAAFEETQILRDRFLEGEDLDAQAMSKPRVDKKFEVGSLFLGSALYERVREMTEQMEPSKRGERASDGK